MYDPTPPPFGDLTRRWTHLGDDARVTHARRLLGSDCTSDLEQQLRHVDCPGLDAGACYERVFSAARRGDEIAIAWMATSHRPLLITRGRALFEHDAVEWAGVCLEALHTTLTRVDPTARRWLRRRMSQHLASRVSWAVARHLKRRRHEASTPVATLTRRVPQLGPGVDPHPDLSLAVERALAQLDPATRDAFLALANEQPLWTVADRHDLSYSAVRQRVRRARPGLQVELARFVREAA